MNYNALIVEHGARDGRFVASLVDASGLAVTSANAEHDLCFAMVRAGLLDGSIQFWWGSTPSIFFASVHRAAKWRHSLGEGFPYLVVKRKKGSWKAENPTTAESQNPEDDFLVL